MKLTKGFIEAISRDYVKFALCEAGKAVCLEKIMQQAERFEDVQICAKGHIYTPYEFALVGGLDSDIKEVRYGKNAKYGLLQNIICYVEKEELIYVTFDVALEDGQTLTTITLDDLLEQSHDSTNGLINELIEIFETFLEEHRMVVPNEEKTDAINEGEDANSIANIYGTDYGWLQEEIKAAYGVVP